MLVGWHMIHSPQGCQFKLYKYVLNALVQWPAQRVTLLIYYKSKTQMKKKVFIRTWRPERCGFSPTLGTWLNHLGHLGTFWLGQMLDLYYHPSTQSWLPYAISILAWVTGLKASNKHLQNGHEIHWNFSWSISETYPNILRFFFFLWHDNPWHW